MVYCLIVSFVGVVIVDVVVVEIKMLGDLVVYDGKIVFVYVGDLYIVNFDGMDLYCLIINVVDEFGFVFFFDGF